MTDTSQPTIKLNISASKIYSILKWIVAINLIFLIGTWVHHSRIISTGKISMQLLLAQFNLALENVAAAWYSSMLLFFIAITALICFWADMKRAENLNQRIINFGWILVAGIFVTLSFDEMGSFHEMIGETSLFKKAAGKGSGWVVFYAIIGIVAVFMVTFFLLKFRGNKKAFLFTVLGVLLYISNPFQEKFEIHSWRAAADPSHWRRPVFFLLLEEGSELFAAFSFLYAFATYAITAALQYNIARNPILLIESKFTNKIITYLVILALLLGVTMFIIHVNAWNFARDDNGIPHNWPPSVTYFFCSICSLYLYFKFDENKNRDLYLLIAFTCMVISAYYGANIYGYSSGFFSQLRYVMIAIAGITAWFSLARFNGLFIKVFIVIWIALMVATVFTSRFYPAAIGYLAAVAMLMALIFCYKGIVKKMQESIR